MPIGEIEALEPGFINNLQFQRMTDDGTEFGKGVQGPSEVSCDEGTARRGQKGRTDCLIMFYILLCTYQLL